MRRVARLALAVLPAAAALLAGAAPGAMAAGKPHANTASHSPPASHQPVHTTPAQSTPAGPQPGAPRGLGGCTSRPPSGVSRLKGEPWAQQALGFSSVWPVAAGRGVTVAVVDSGVDYTSQLARRVSYIDETGTGPADCVGHGTAVASIIAAGDERHRGIPFYGVAPAARILSVKVNSGEKGHARLLANGIYDAARYGAKVINVSIQGPNTPALHNAVIYAQRHNAVIVAAAGNDNPGSNQKGPFYPAAYPGVLSVAAVDQTGAVTSYTDTRTPIAVSAPGANVASDWPTGFSPDNQGTSFATAFVSGEAALVRSADRRLSAARVVRRIIATCDGTIGAHSGAGMINPVQALTSALPSRPGPVPASPPPVSVPRLPAGNPLTRTVAVSVAGGAIAVAVIVVICAMVLPHGRRRHWRPGRADLPAIASKSDLTASDWGEEPAIGHELIGPGSSEAPRSLPSA